MGFSHCAQRFFRGPNMLKIGSNIFSQNILIFFSNFEKKCRLDWGRNQVLVPAFSKLTLKQILNFFPCHKPYAGYGWGRRCTPMTHRSNLPFLSLKPCYSLLPPLSTSIIIFIIKNSQVADHFPTIIFRDHFSFIFQMY